jgi:hypothetical protein
VKISLSARPVSFFATARFIVKSVLGYQAASSNCA